MLSPSGVATFLSLAAFLEDAFLRQLQAKFSDQLAYNTRSGKEIVGFLSTITGLHGIRTTYSHRTILFNIPISSKDSYVGRESPRKVSIAAVGSFFQRVIVWGSDSESSTWTFLDELTLVLRNGDAYMASRA